jgi:hypothetical protein
VDTSGPLEYSGFGEKFPTGAGDVTLKSELSGKLSFKRSIKQLIRGA